MQFVYRAAMLNGIAMGSIYALVTLGLALVYGIMRILHVAHAAVFTIGAYAGLLVFNFTGSLTLAFLGSMVISAVIGVLIERFVYLPSHEVPALRAPDREHCGHALHRGSPEAHRGARISTPFPRNFPFPT